METETTTTPRPATLGPTGMELRPEAPKGTGLSKRGGVLAILAVGALVALIIYGIFLDRAPPRDGPNVAATRTSG